MERQQETRITARACQFCRRRKIKCDAQKPSCTTCRTSNRTCSYQHAPPKPRPSTARLNAIQDEKKALECVLARLKSAPPEHWDSILASVDLGEGQASVPGHAATSPASGERDITGDGYPTPSDSRTREALDDADGVSSDEDCDVSNFLSVDEGGQVGIFGPTSAFRVGTTTKTTPPGQSASSQGVRYQLIANAAMGRQREHELRNLRTIRGVPAELALHLLDLHWNRQHHTFLLTYRPAFMRELVDGGPYCSDFLLNAVFACASKFSERLEVRSDPADPETAGQSFFARCEELITQQSLLSRSQIPTIIGLVMLGSTYNARGLSSKGWLYTGYALRMVFDLGLHLDCEEIGGNAEEIEIRRRVFWGVFICEKLQSLYLGRPVTIQLRDAHVSRDLMDTFEELEPWSPYVDPKIMTDRSRTSDYPTIFMHSVSVFQQLCLLSKIMTRIINKIYFVGATTGKTVNDLKPLDDALTAWYQGLPPHVVFEPWNRNPIEGPARGAPNLTILHTTYNSLVILLHRPFISRSDTVHTSVSANSWKKCTTAARNITNLALTYRSTYPLRKSNYMLSYAVYVACTIHVHNATSATGAAEATDSSLLGASLRCLDELAVPNSGVADTARRIRRLMAAKGIQEDLCLVEPTSSMPQGFDESWQLFSGSPNSEDPTQLQSFVDFGIPGHDLLFGFMSDNFSNNLSPATFHIDAPH